MTFKYRTKVHNLTTDIYQKYGISITLNEWKDEQKGLRIEFHVSGALIGDSYEAMSPKEAYRSLLVAQDLLEIFVGAEQ